MPADVRKGCAFPGRYFLPFCGYAARMRQSLSESEDTHTERQCLSAHQAAKPRLLRYLFFKGY